MVMNIANSNNNENKKNENNQNNNNNNNVQTFDNIFVSMNENMQMAMGMSMFPGRYKVYKKEFLKLETEIGNYLSQFLINSSHLTRKLKSSFLSIVFFIKVIKIIFRINQ